MVSFRGELFRRNLGDETFGLEIRVISMSVKLKGYPLKGHSQALSATGENRYPPPLMVRITAGLAGSGSILRRIRMIRRSTARSKASLSRALANSSRRSRDSTRFGF